MIRHSNPEKISPRETPKEGMEKVVVLPKPIDTSVSVDRFKRAMREAAHEIADRYLCVTNGTVDNARLNDVVLRAVMQFPLRVQQNISLFNARLAELYEDVQALLRLRGVREGDRDKLADQLKTLASSVYQLSSFVRTQREKDPTRRFGTSPWLDVMYGYDLIRATPVWVPEARRLEIGMTAFQAKASAAFAGVSQAEIRGLPKTYEGQKGRADRELSFDSNWFVNLLVTGMRADLRQSLEHGMRDPESARAFLESAASASGAPFEMWMSDYVRSALVAHLRSARQAELPGVVMSGTGVPFLFLVDTPTGIRVLTKEKAESYVP